MSNVLKDLPNDAWPPVKDHISADNGAGVWKNERGAQERDRSTGAILLFPSAINIVKSNAVPPTEVDGAIYLLDNTNPNLTISVIAWQSGTTTRITFSGTPDLSVYAVNDWIYIKSAVNAVNNGVFQITAINDGSDYVEVTNALKTSATYDETTGGIGSISKAEWDGCPQNSWVRFNVGAGTWAYILPGEGRHCFSTSRDVLYYFDGTEWKSSGKVFSELKTSYAGSQEVKVQAGIQTTDATVTPISSVEVPNNSMVVISGYVSGFRDDYTEALGAWFFVVFRRAGGGTNVTQVGTSVITIREDFAGAPVVTCAADVGTQSAQIQVTGEAAKNINWTTTYTYQRTYTNV